MWRLGAYVFSSEFRAEPQVAEELKGLQEQSAPFKDELALTPGRTRVGRKRAQDFEGFEARLLSPQPTCVKMTK